MTAAQVPARHICPTCGGHAGFVSHRDYLSEPRRTEFRPAFHALCEAGDHLLRIMELLPECANKSEAKVRVQKAVMVAAGALRLEGDPV